MGMSTHITGIRDLDGRFAEMIAVKLACESAGVEYPQAVKDYFCGCAGESEEYLRREMESVSISVAIEKVDADSSEGWILDLAKLPPEVKAIRFENSY